MGATVFYLLRLHQFKEKDTEIKKYPLCLGNILGAFSVNNI